MKNKNESEMYLIEQEPHYIQTKNEVSLFKAAFQSRLSVMLKGPTGCGKTRFVEYMAYQLKLPLITVACHEDLFASDLIGRYLLFGDETIWIDGPLAKAVRLGGICYLDEVVEARKDTTVLMHPLTDTRRFLPIDKKGEIIHAHPNFFLVISYNPGYQSVLKDLKPSTRQRFIAIEFNYPPPDIEAQIVHQEGSVSIEIAHQLVFLATKIRNIKEQGLQEGASTRLLIFAAHLIQNGVSIKQACYTAICQPLTDDERLLETLYDLVEDAF